MAEPLLSSGTSRPDPRAAAGAGRWPEESRETAERLHRLLTIQDRDWHALKSQRDRRAAEQLAAALVQLLSGEGPAGPQGQPSRRNAIELVEHALGWLRGERKDPGCPSHGR